MLPAIIPIFPLPTVVLFPNVYLPLHIFEPRYRQMVSDALAGRRMIGMVLLRPGYESEYEDAPAVYEIGCVGVITHVEQLAGGEFNIVLRGLDKFRIVREQPRPDTVLYRQVAIAPLIERVVDDERAELKQRRQRLEALLEPLMAGTRATGRLPKEMPDEDVVNALAQYLEFEPVEKQALLEMDGPLARCRSLVELLEMNALADRSQGGAGQIH
jgi:Lon protease-like protein